MNWQKRLFFLICIQPWHCMRCDALLYSMLKYRVFQQVLDHFEDLIGPFLDNISIPLKDHFETVFGPLTNGPFCAIFEPILDRFKTIFGTIFGPYYDHFWTILGSIFRLLLNHFLTISDHFRTIWDHFRNHFKTIVGPF